MSKYVRVGSVRRFDSVKPDKAQALKVLEEAAEVFGAWQVYEKAGKGDVFRDVILDECADVIQATLNLVAALGVEDFREWVDRCEQRQRERGRITDGN